MKRTWVDSTIATPSMRIPPSFICESDEGLSVCIPEVARGQLRYHSFFRNHPPCFFKTASLAGTRLFLIPLRWLLVSPRDIPLSPPSKSLAFAHEFWGLDSGLVLTRQALYWLSCLFSSPWTSSSYAGVRHALHPLGFRGNSALFCSSPPSLLPLYQCLESLFGYFLRLKQLKNQLNSKKKNGL